MKNMYVNFHEKDSIIDISMGYEEYCGGDGCKKEWAPFLSFPITKTCNFHCIYCGQGGEATSSQNHLIGIDMIKTTVEEAVKHGVVKFRITGGEPFTHPNIDEILMYFSEMGYYTLINTNGSLIAKHEKLIRRLNTNLRFAVSLDTLKADKLPLISGYTNHKDVIRGIELLSECGLLLRTNMVVNKENYEEIYDIINYCSKLGCDLKLLDVVSVPVPYGVRKDFYQEVNTLEEEFKGKADCIYSHEYTRSYGTPCYRYKFGNCLVTVKNSKKGSHYDIDGLCNDCKYYPCHEGLYDLFALSDGRLCSCRWTEKQKYTDLSSQMEYLIEAFNRSKFVFVGDNKDMKSRDELRGKL